MTNKCKNVLFTACAVLFWISLWEILSLIVENAYLLPGVFDTFEALFEILSKSKFYLSLLATLLRVFLGFSLSVITGSLLAFLSYKYKIVYKMLSPLISVMKSTPVASFALLLWVVLSGNAHTVTIAFLMVMPIVFQNLYDGFNSISPELSELCDVFEFSFKKRMKHLVLPTLFSYFIPAVISGTGFAWKAGIAAEIIGYTANSIGEWINDSRQNYDTASIFALTLVIILLSVIIEKLIKFLLTKARERSLYI